MSVRLMTLALLATALVPAFSHADEVQNLRNELQALKSEYATRLEALEARLAQIEGASAGAPAVAAAGSGAATQAPAPSLDQVPPQASPQDNASPQDEAPPPLEAYEPPPSPALGGSGGATAFNPAMSVIMVGNYANLSQDPATYSIAGFMPSGGEIGPGERSFNLGESELTMSANIDPYFYGNVTAAISGDGEIGVEEAYVRTLALAEGFTAKVGRFFSGIGYLNELHAHAWDFVDQPLAYQAFFGGQLGQDGVQVKWLAPTDLFVEVGAESGNGDAFPGTRRSSNGLNGVTAFVHVGSDIGETTSWRAGASYVDLKAEGRTYEDSDDMGNAVLNAFDGTSRTWVADFVVKWAPQGNSARRYLKVQGEYLHRTEEGDLTFDLDGAALGDAYRSKQSGWYVQSVYQFRPRWRVGARYDALDSGDTRIALVDSGVLPGEAFPALLSASPTRTTLMLDFSPSEFSRLRGQFAWDDARDAESDRQFQLQYIYSLGAHGAHKY